MTTTKWPECRNCEEPVAAYKNDPSKPRAYCSDECMAEWPFYKTLGGRKAIKDIAPWWPVCLNCRERPRAVADPKYQNIHTPTVTEIQRARSQARRDGVEFEEPVVIFKFCSTSCRAAMLAPFYDVDRLDDFREVTA